MGHSGSFVPKRRRKQRHRKLRASRYIGLVAFLVLALGQEAGAQRWADMAWKPFFEQEGVRFSYIFYPRADGDHDGVVIKLENTNAYPVRYRFTVVFRSEGVEIQQEVSGTIPAQSMITGDRHGLFWIPFKDGKRIYELGLRKWHISPLESS